MILGSEEISRVRRLEGVMCRLLEANRWLAEFDDILGPMWDFIMGKRVVCIFDEKANELERMSERDIASVREKLRERLGQGEPK